METSKIIRKLECNGEFQDLTRRFVNQNVYYCISSLVSELVKDEKYSEDLIECSCKRSEDNEDEYFEAYEHWIVSDWLANKLLEHEELITKDFLGLTIWGRTTTGQAIYIDHVIIEIMLETGFGEVQINKLMNEVN